MSNQKPFNRILVIDDDIASTFLTKMTLEDMDIAENILTAPDGMKGLEVIKKHCLNEHAAKEECPDLILLDINMPIMSGLEVVQELDKIGQSNLIQAKIVILTTSSNPRDKEQLIHFNVKDYLEKPVSESKILSLIGDQKSNKSFFV